MSAVHDAGAANERIQTTIPAARGLLGAGVYDEEARLVGVVTSSPKEAAAVAFAVPADWVPEVAARGAAALAARSKPAPATAGGASAAGSPGLPTAGTTWTYAHFERQYTRRQTNYTVQVLRVDGQVVEEAISASGGNSARRVVNTGETRVLEQLIGGNVVVMELSPYLLAASAGKAPADFGTASGYPVGGAGLPNWVYRISAQDWEQVAVPAGTFRALRIDVSGQRERQMFTNATVTGRFRISAWYAPDIKRLVRVEHKAWLGGISTEGQPGGDEVIELLKYLPGT